jgi:predicted Rossmann-fold nucleotide-binding protein
MEAANAGVRMARHEMSRSYGLTLDVPTLSEAANAHLDIKSSHKRFSSRLDEFVRLSHGVVVAPGGIGTLLELMYIWQLLQVNMVEQRPVVLLGTAFWGGLLRWMQNAQMAERYISVQYLERVRTADCVAEVVNIMAQEQEQYHSRYKQDRIAA